MGANKMILKDSSLVTAQAIVDKLQANEHVMCGKTFWYLEAYQNGREQGFTLYALGDIKVAYFIAEHRSSDRPVIYKGAYSMQSLSEDAYKHPNFFDGVDEAVEWMVKELTNE